MVMSWLINSMENEIGQTFMFYATTQEIWEVAKKTYSDNENTVEFFKLQSTLSDLKQDKMDVTHYFNQMTRYWQQHDQFEELKWDYPNDSQRYKKFVEKQKLFAFLN